MKTPADILITGAGPVGLTAALELCNRGCMPKIIDSDGEPSPESRALAIHARTLDILEPSGVSARMLQEGNKVTGVIIRDDTDELATISFSDLPHKHNFILVLPQSRTEEILIEALREQGLEVCWHTRLNSLKATGNGFECALSANGKISQDHHSIVIGADGAHSTVRKQLGIAFEGESIAGEWSLADIELAGWPYPFDMAVMTWMAQGPVGFIPMGEGYGRFVSPGPDVCNHLPKQAKVKKVFWKSEFHVSYRQVSTYQKGNAFLAGDAAHIHSPLGGRGMNLGIEDAATLAWLINQNRTGDYTRLRQPVGAKVLRFTHQQTRWLTAWGKWSKFMMAHLIPTLMSFKPFRTRALEQMSGLDTPVPPWLKS